MKVGGGGLKNGHFFTLLLNFLYCAKKKYHMWGGAHVKYQSYNLSKNTSVVYINNCLFLTESFVILFDLQQFSNLVRTQALFYNFSPGMA